MLEVTCAIIREDNKILICQRSDSMKLPLKWEFPGGKIESNETKEQCIIREIKEELNLDIKILKPLSAVEHQYENFLITLYPFICLLIGGNLKAAEHKQAIWVKIDSLKNFDWAEADLPIVDQIID